MLNIVVYYPVSGYFNEDVISKDYPKIIKDKIIEKAGEFYKDEDVSVAFIPVFAAGHPVLVILYCDRRTRDIPAIDESTKLFYNMIDDALKSCCEGKKFSIHTIFSDDSRFIGLDKNLQTSKADVN